MEKICASETPRVRNCARVLITCLYVLVANVKRNYPCNNAVDSIVDASAYFFCTGQSTGFVYKLLCVPFIAASV